MAALMKTIWCLPWSYPEIILAFVFFILFRRLIRKDEIITNWPIVGMLPALLHNINRLHDWPTEILRRTGCTFVLRGPWFSQMDIFCTCDPANVLHIFNTNFSNFPKGPEFSKIFDLLGDGIFNSDSESWRIQRKLAHNLMTSKNFRAFVAKTSKEKVEGGLMDVLKQIAGEGDRGVVDLQDVFQRFTFDNTCILVFGSDPGSLSLDFPTIPFAKAMDDSMEALAFRHAIPESWWKLLRWLNIGFEKKLGEASKIIDHFINENVSMRREQLNKSTSEGGDLLTSYMSHQFEEEEFNMSKSDKFLRDTAMNLMLAGRDTTSSALTWFFWLISVNPKVEAEILEELRANFPETREEEYRVFDPEELNRCVYLHAALCESLRLYPPVPFEHKGVVHPEVLPSGHTVRCGTKILLHLYAMGRMESIWGEDCLEFKPQRWISERGRVKFEPSYKFMAFNSGPRTCIGKEVAFTQMKTVAAALLYNFHFQSLDGHPIAPKLSIILHMKNGLKVQVKERRSG